MGELFTLLLLMEMIEAIRFLPLSTEVQQKSKFIQDTMTDGLKTSDGQWLMNSGIAWALMITIHMITKRGMIEILYLLCIA